MNLKLLFVIAALTFFGQIVFSFYYSVKIVDENTLINKNQNTYNILSTQHQLLEIDLASLNSIYTYEKLLQPKSDYIPITNFLDLTN
jgi:hypothetical protein